MTSHLKSYPDGLRQLFVRAEAADVDAVFRRAAAEIQKNYQIPGFRKGKVPLEMIEKQNPPELLAYAERIFSADALAEVEALGMGLFGQPRFNPMSGLSSGKEFIFALVFEEYPSLKDAPDFSKDTIEYEECILDEAFIAEMACKQAGLMDTASSAAKDGDMVKVLILNKDYTGAKPEAAFDASKLTLLEGKKAGDKISLSFDSLGGYLPEFLGKCSDPVEVELVEVSRPKAWAKVTDEEVAAKSPFKTKGEYLEATKHQLTNMAEQINGSRKTEALTKHVGSRLNLEIPKSLWLNNLRDLAVKTAENEVIRGEVALKDLGARKDIAEKFTALPMEAKNGISFIFWLDAAAEKENIRLEGPELDYYLYRYAQQENMSMADFQKRLSSDDKLSLQREAVREKALTHLMSFYNFKAKGSVPFAEVWKKR